MNIKILVWKGNRIIENKGELNIPFPTFQVLSTTLEQDRMSTDAIEGLRDSQDLDDWQYNDDSYIHLPSQCRYSNIHFALIIKYP